MASLVPLRVRAPIAGLLLLYAAFAAALVLRWPAAGIGAVLASSVLIYRERHELGISVRNLVAWRWVLIPIPPALLAEFLATWPLLRSPSATGLAFWLVLGVVGVAVVTGVLVGFLAAIIANIVASYVRLIRSLKEQQGAHKRAV